jgi:hypothetical protein
MGKEIKTGIESDERKKEVNVQDKDKQGAKRKGN